MLTALVTGCASTQTASPGADCAALGPPPITRADADAVSDDLARWLAVAVEFCGWN